MNPKNDVKINTVKSLKYVSSLEKLESFKLVSGLISNGLYRILKCWVEDKVLTNFQVERMFEIGSLIFVI